MFQKTSFGVANSAPPQALGGLGQSWESSGDVDVVRGSFERVDPVRMVLDMLNLGAGEDRREPRVLSLPWIQTSGH